MTVRYYHNELQVTGGSSGIGKYLAIEAIKKGANVSIFARNSTLMEEARAEILKFAVSQNDQKVSCYSGIAENVLSKFTIIII